jgi:hypothetical protein
MHIIVPGPEHCIRQAVSINSKVGVHTYAEYAKSGVVTILHIAKVLHILLHIIFAYRFTHCIAYYAYLLYCIFCTLYCIFCIL